VPVLEVVVRPLFINLLPTQIATVSSAWALHVITTLRFLIWLLTLGIWASEERSLSHTLFNERSYFDVAVFFHLVTSERAMVVFVAPPASDLATLRVQALDDALRRVSHLHHEITTWTRNEITDARRGCM
jgi:hypothetical protein